MLEAPVPLIVGVTEQEYELLLEDGIVEHEADQKVWIHLRLTHADTHSGKMGSAREQSEQFLPLKIENLEILLD